MLNSQVHESTHPNHVHYEPYQKQQLEWKLSTLCDWWITWTKASACSTILPQFPRSGVTCSPLNPHCCVTAHSRHWEDNQRATPALNGWWRQELAAHFKDLLITLSTGTVWFRLFLFLSVCVGNRTFQQEFGHLCRVLFTYHRRESD